MFLVKLYRVPCKSSVITVLVELLVPMFFTVTVKVAIDAEAPVAVPVLEPVFVISSVVVATLFEVTWLLYFILLV